MGTTVTLAQPRTPSMLAKMTVLPCALALTIPDTVTSAIDGVLLDQVIVRPVNTWPLGPSACAVSAKVRPTTINGADGATATESTGVEVTVISAVPVFPPLVAEMVALPGTPPVTMPLDETDATVLFDEE